MGWYKRNKINMEELKVYMILSCIIIGLIVLTVLINLYPYLTLGSIIFTLIVALRIVGINKICEEEEDDKDRNHFL